MMSATNKYTVFTEVVTVEVVRAVWDSVRSICVCVVEGGNLRQGIRQNFGIQSVSKMVNEERL